MKRNPLPIFIFAGSLLGIALFLYSNLESYTAEKQLGPIPEVRLNPWYAAQAFLQQQHQQASQHALDLQSILNDLQPQDTLVLHIAQPIQNPITIKKLSDWIQKGGHLILNSHEEWDNSLNQSGDAFLDAFDIRLHYLDEDSDSESSLESDTDSFDDLSENLSDEHSENLSEDHNDDTEMTSSSQEADEEALLCLTEFNAPEPYLIQLPRHQRVLQIDSEFGPLYSLSTASGNTIEDSGYEPNSLLQVAIGNGRLTVLINTGIWLNSAIGDYDHAHLLGWLVSQSRKVWFNSHVQESENLIQRIWRIAPLFVFSTLMLILLWAWRQWRSFGPLQPEPSPHRRRQLEHIEAEARFNWQHHHLEPTLTILRDKIQVSVFQSLHLSYQTSPDTWLKAVANYCELPFEQVHHAMTTPVPKRELEWIELISLLQTIRNRL